MVELESESLLDAYKDVNIEKITLTFIKETLEGVEANIEAIKDSSIPLQGQKEVREMLKNLKDYKIALLNVKQEKIRSLLNSVFCDWCESHGRTKESRNKTYWITSLREPSNSNSLGKFDHTILCEECLKDWLKNKEKIAFAFPAVKCPEAI
jgi:hypothetical protein